jgi:tetratricopeptide (TPR) repeat protein
VSRDRFASCLETKWHARLVLAAISLLAYADSFNLGLAVDARFIIQTDTRIHAATGENLGLILTKSYWWPGYGDRLYRPVTTASYLFNYVILGAGEDPGGYHTVNFLLHTINVWLVWELALLVLKRREPAFFAAALWAVHPLGTEAVANVAGRADLLAAMAVLGGTCLYARSAAWRGRRAWMAAATLFGISATGLLSKENAAVLVGMMVLWDFSFGGGSGQPAVLRRIPAYAAVAASLVLLLWARRSIFGTEPIPLPLALANPLVLTSFWASRLTAIKVIALDLWLLVWPFHLSSDRSFNQISLFTWHDTAGWCALAAIGAVLALALAQFRRDRALFWSVGFVACALLPTANLLFLIGSICAERFLYLPAVGFAVAVAALAYRHGEHPGARAHPAVILGLILALWTGRTLIRNRDWNNDLTLALADIGTAPQSFGLHQRLADALFDQDPQRNIDAAIREAETAWRMLDAIPPEYKFQKIAANLGGYYRSKADSLGGASTAEGRALLERARAVLLEGRDAARAAERSFDAAQRGTPSARGGADPNVYFNLGAVCALLGRYSEALESYRYGRSLVPASAEPYDEMALLYSVMGDPKMAEVMRQEKALLEGKDPRSDPCPAFEDLAGAFAEGRQWPQTRALRDRANRSYGCRPSQF